MGSTARGGASAGSRGKVREAVFGTPRFHDGHRAAADDATDTNFAVRRAFLNRLFGRRVRSASAAQGAWPDRYGLAHAIANDSDGNGNGNGDDRMPNGYFAQLAYPFRRRNRER